MGSIGSWTEKDAVPQPYKLTAEEKQKHLTMMKNPNEWPRWPFLPVKLPMSFGLPMCGVLYDSFLGPTVKPVVYDNMLWTPEAFDLDKKLGEFETFEALLEAGWVVD